jgi:hypothetical protein
MKFAAKPQSGRKTGSPKGSRKTTTEAKKIGIRGK